MFWRRMTDKPHTPSIVKKLAKIGFWFFFIKGILWLTIPALLVWLGLECGS